MGRLSISSESTCSTVDLEAAGLAFPSEVHHKSSKQDVWPNTPSEDEKHNIKHYRHFSIQPPPPDRGHRAWGYLLGAFIVEALCWGFPLSFGVFQNFLSSHPPFQGSDAISIIGTLSGGLAYLGTPFSMKIVARFPGYRTPMMCFGLCMCALACVGASFATKVWHLILTQGVVYGVGTSLMYVPTLSYMNEWFVARRGLAYGIMFGGTGVSGLVLPLLFEKLLSVLGFANTLRIWAGILVGLTAPAIYFLIKGRIPLYKITAVQSYSFSFFKKRLFLCIAFSNLAQGLGYFIPGIYLPSYASDLSMTSLQSTIVLSLLNLMSVFGQVALGHLADRIGSTQPLFWSTFIGAFSVCLLWGFSKTFVALILFSIVYGLSAGGYSVLLSRFGLEIAPEDSNAQLSMYGVFAFERGVGNILAGPISVALLKGTVDSSHFALSKYEGLVIFTSITMALSSLAAFGNLAGTDTSDTSDPDVERKA